MSDFELIANDIHTAISTSESRINSFGYSHDIGNSISVINATFTSWMLGYEEERQASLGRSNSFKNSVIGNLPNTDDVNWKSYIIPPPGSTLKKRCMDLWAIRIAFTHGNGNINRILDPEIRSWAYDIDIRGASVVGDRITVNGAICHHAIRTIVQVQDVLS